MRASTELDNLLAVSEFIKHEEDDGRHPDATKGWDIYKTAFKLNDQYFEGEAKIKCTDRGYVFYDITQIKRTARKSGQADIKPAATSGNPSDTNIAQGEYSVNTSIRESGAEYDKNEGREIVLENGKVRYSLATSFSDQVDEALTDDELAAAAQNKKSKFTENHLYLGKTPEYLKKFGLNTDLSLLVTRKHIQTMYQESGPDKSVTYHGLSKNIIKRLPEAIKDRRW